MSFTADQLALLPRHYHRLGPFAAFFRTGYPVLTYHAIESAPSGTAFRGLFYPAHHFRTQLKELTSAGFSSQFDSSQSPRALPGANRILLTFDDGYRSLVQNAMPALADTRHKGLVFLVADRLGGTNDWDSGTGVASRPLMDPGEIREWLAAGHRIGSHTCTHAHLSQVSEARARAEIFESRKKLEDLFAQPVTEFCYPYGEWTRQIRDLVHEAGYTSAYTTENGVNSADADPFLLNRVTVRKPVRSLKEFRKWFRRTVLTFTGRFPR